MPDSDPDRYASFFEEASTEQPSFVRELWEFLRHNRKWWLTPIILSLLVLGALVFLGGSSLAPLLYPFW
jgi:hypothetical protein